MGKFIWGPVAALVLLFSFVPAANAGPIPPTANCQAIIKKQLKKELKDGSDGNVSAAEDERVAKLLESNGCISDAEPLYAEVEVKPFTNQCRDAAANADKYWGTANRKVGRVFRPLMKRGRAHERRIKLIDRRIKSLRQNDRDGQAAALLRTRKQANRVFGKRAREVFAKIMPLYRDVGYDSLLIVLEFMSLRCVAVDFPADGRFNTPVLKAIEKNADLLFISILFLALESEQGSKARASIQSAEPSLIEASSALLSRP